MGSRRLSISLKRSPAMVVSRVTLAHEKLVYVLVASRKLSYPRGKSRIAYIGTTKRGLSRIAGSVATRAKDILRRHGVVSFEARILTCKPRQRVKTWRKLERGLILTFREEFGQVPRCNIQGKNMKWTNELKFFRAERLGEIVQRLS